MHMLRCLFYIEATFGFHLRCFHIPGAMNTAADSLSRDNVESFVQVPFANRVPDTPSDQLVRALTSQSTDWLSPAWRETFISSLRRASLTRPTEHTRQE